MLKNDLKDNCKTIISICDIEDITVTLIERLSHNKFEKPIKKIYEVLSINLNSISYLNIPSLISLLILCF